MPSGLPSAGTRMLVAMIDRVQRVVNGELDHRIGPRLLNRVLAACNGHCRRGDVPVDDLIGWSCICSTQTGVQHDDGNGRQRENA